MLLLSLPPYLWSTVVWWSAQIKVKFYISMLMMERPGNWCGLIHMEKCGCVAELLRLDLTFWRCSWFISTDPAGEGWGLQHQIFRALLPWACLELI